MTPAEWWLVFDAKRADREKLDRKPSRKEYRDMKAFAEQGRRNDDLLKVAQGGEPR